MNYDVDPTCDNNKHLSFRGSFGSDQFDRRKLPPVAKQRFQNELHVDSFNENIIIIGDTPRDIDCAKFNNFKSLGVATGSYSFDELVEAGGDLVVENFENYEKIIQDIYDLF